LLPDLINSLMFFPGRQRTGSLEEISEETITALREFEGDDRKMKQKLRVNR
jgi:hypothetical protein